MKFLLPILLIIVLYFVSVSSTNAQAIQLPAPMFCIGSCPTLTPSPSPTAQQPSVTINPSTTPNSMTTGTPTLSYPPTSGSPTHAANPCIAQGVTAQSAGSVSTFHYHGKERFIGKQHGWIQQFFQFLIQLLQLLFEQLANPFPSGPCPSPSATPSAGSGTTSSVTPSGSPSPSSGAASPSISSDPLGSRNGNTNASGCSAGSTLAPCMNGTGSGTGTPGWKPPVFDDEFNGTSLNTSNWVTGRRGGGNGGYNPSIEEETFSPSALTVSGGYLTITATQHSSNSWTSGTIEAQSNNNFTYGFFEARIKVPDPSQAWTAWWLTGSNTWPPELDIFEFHFCGSQPTFNNDGTPSQNPNGANLPGWPCSQAYGGSSTDFTQWHTYGMLWTSSAIKIYFDGKLQSITTSGSGNSIPNTPMYPILDYAISKGTTPPNNSKMQVDYVRIWQL